MKKMREGDRTALGFVGVCLIIWAPVIWKALNG